MTMDARETVLEICKERAQTHSVNFFATYVAGVAKIPPREAEALLDELVEQGRIARKYDLSCPDCGRTVEYAQTVQEQRIFDGECPKCGEYIITRLEEYKPVYTPVEQMLSLSPAASPDDPRLRNSLLSDGI